MSTDREAPQTVQDTYGSGAFYGPDGKVYIVASQYNPGAALPSGTQGNWSQYANYLNSQMQPLSNFQIPEGVTPDAANAWMGGGPAAGVLPYDTITNAALQYGMNYNPKDDFMTQMMPGLILGLGGAGLMGSLPGTTSIFGEGGSLGSLFGGGDNVLSGINPASWISPTDTFAAGESGLGAFGTDIGNVPVSLLSGPDAGGGASLEDFYGSPNENYPSIGQGNPSTVMPADNGITLGGILDWAKQNPGLVGAGANLLGSGIQAYSANKAANTQANAAMQAIAAQQGIYNQQRADLSPWMQTGQAANTTLAGLTGLQPGGGFNQNAMLVKPFGMSDLQADPFFKPEFTQLSQDVLNRHSALGGVNSGATLKDLNDYALATGYQNAYNRYNNNLNNVWNRLYSLSGSGQNAAATTGGFAGQLGAGMAQNLTGAGNAQAAGQVGVGNALGGGLAGAYNAYLTNQILNNPGTTVQLKV